MIARPQSAQCGFATQAQAPLGRRVSFIECHTCGFEPDEQLSIRQGRCPKCHGFAWQRVYQSQRSLVDYTPTRGSRIASIALGLS